MALTEEQWQRQVVDLASLYGWDYVYHTHRSEHSAPGWPDLALIRRKDRRIVFAELKSPQGSATPDQLAVLEVLLAVSEGGWTDHGRRDIGALVPGMARIDVELWQPGDLDRVVQVLA